MSAFFLAINRNNAPFEVSMAKGMMAQIDRFGPDSKKLIVQDHYAIGYQAHWTVPEESIQEQPMLLGEHLYLLFHGRIDNRLQLLEKLELDITLVLSDADIVARCYREYGNDAVDLLRGPFVAVFFNTVNNDVVAFRDAMGGRYLVYSITDHHILIATYEMALVAHESVPYEINREKAARHLSNTMEQQPQSLIKGLKPLNPGMILSVTALGIDLHRYYSFSPDTRVELDSDQAYALEYKRLLNQAVMRRLRRIGRPGIMLSGGLDSIPIAILAAKNSDDLLAFSWVFEQFPDLDERQYSSPVCQQFGIEQVMINCDQLWPKFDESMDLNPIVPFGIPFSEFQEETLRQAKRRGVTVMLTGIHGDLLYEYTNGVLYELLKEGEWSRFFNEFSHLWQAASSPLAFIKHYVLRPLRVVQIISAKRRQKNPLKSDMLVKELADQVIEKPHWLLSNSVGALRPQQWQVVLDGFAGDDAVHGRYLDAKYLVERRYPFRDRDLCEFMLSIPSHQLYFALQKRPIVKQAFVKEFGPNLLNRNTKTVFSDVIYTGIANDLKNKHWYESQPAQWTDYVKHCYFDAKTTQNQSLGVVRWRCGYYDYWKSVCYNPLAQGSGLKQKNEHEIKNAKPR